jgi:hypothetical protein
MSINKESNVTTVPVSDNSSIFDSMSGTFSNKNAIIIILLSLLILSLIGINLFRLLGIIVDEIVTPLVPSVRNLLSMIGFTTGVIIKGSADLVANTTTLGVDIAKGTTHSIGDMLISSTNPGIDSSRQISLTDVIRVPNLNYPINSPQPVQSSASTVTPINTQKPKAGWCYVGEFSNSRGCVEVSEHDKCMSGQIFANQSECLKPSK